MDSNCPELKANNFSFEHRLLGFPNSESTRESTVHAVSGLEIPFNKWLKRELAINGKTKKAQHVYYTSPCEKKFQSR